MQEKAPPVQHLEPNKSLIMLSLSPRLSTRRKLCVTPTAPPAWRPCAYLSSVVCQNDTCVVCDRRHGISSHSILQWPPISGDCPKSHVGTIGKVKKKCLVIFFPSHTQLSAALTNRPIERRCIDAHGVLVYQVSVVRPIGVYIYTVL